MNVVKIYGGLGNQFFQYAFGKVMESYGSEVQYDISWYKVPMIEHPRPFSLEKFNVRIRFNKLISTQKTINEVKMQYHCDPMFLKMKDTNFYGYWQHPEYYTEIMPQLKSILRVKKEFYTNKYVELKEQIMCSDSVALHVRRGDYVSINGHHLLQLDYYERCLKLFPGKRIFVFSDDIPWCKAHYEGAQFTFIDLPEEYLVFELMRFCKHQIIANSTFSWWAATLNENPNKKITTPTRWRVNEEEQSWMDHKLFWPEGWIRVKG